MAGNARPIGLSVVRAIMDVMSEGSEGFSLFATAIGTCAAQTAVAEAIVRMRTLMDGAQDDLADVQLDWSRVSHFDRRVHGIGRPIEPGSTLTYGEVARRLGDHGAAQAVGQALGRNPF